MATDPDRRPCGSAGRLGYGAKALRTLKLPEDELLQGT